VRATNNAGSSGYAETSKAPMWTAAPNVPTGLGAVATTTIGELTFTWSAPSADSKHSAAASYQVRTSTDGVNWSSAGDKNSPYTHSFGSSGSGSRYMQVKAQNSAGSSAYVDKSGSPMWIAKPNVPEDLAIAATQVTGELVLSWSEPSTDNQHSAAQTYQVQTSTNDVDWTTQNGNKTSPYTYDFGTTGSGKRYIRVKATNSAGSSGYVGLGETPFWALPTPGLPTFVHLMPKSSHGKMYFKFKMPSANVSLYQTRYAIDSGAWVNGTATTAANNGSYEVNLKTVTAGQTIKAQVRAGNSTGQWSGWAGTWEYAVVASPIHVDPESSGHYREGMWGRSTNWTKPYQGFYSSSSATYQGYYFYGDRIRAAIEKTGRTFTKAVPTFYRPQSGSAEGSCGNGQAGESIYVGVHSQKINPGSRNDDVPFAPITNITVIGSPANGRSVNTESLSTAALNALVDGTKNGIGFDANAGGGGGRPYLCMHSFGTENTGRISFHHLG
jgi:hypothetical protein